MYLMPTRDEIDELVQDTLNEYMKKVKEELMSAARNGKVAVDDINKVLERIISEYSSYYFEVDDRRQI